MMIDFDERQLKEIAWSIFYTVNFAHGTTGHNQLIVISKLAQANGFSLGRDGEGNPSLLHDGRAILRLEIGHAN